MAAEKLTTHAVILAGGRGTRFWPRSRTRTPKQLLNIVGEDTMLEQTVARLRPLVPPERIWTVTNREQAAGCREASSAAGAPARFDRAHRTQHRRRDRARGHSCAPRSEAATRLMAVLPADHYIANPERYRVIVKAALEMAADPRKMVVLGIPPTRPDTGFGYIERTGNALDTRKAFPSTPCAASRKSRRSRWRKNMPARGFITGTPGCFSGASRRFSTIWKTICRRLTPRSKRWRRASAKRPTTRIFATFIQALENISVDYAILEPATREQGAPRVFVIPAEVGWSDIGSWAAVYELLAKRPGENIFASDGSRPRHRRRRQFLLEPEEIRRRHRRQGFSRRGNCRRAAHLPA